MTRISGAAVLFLLAVAASRPQQVGENKGAGRSSKFYAEGQV